MSNLHHLLQAYSKHPALPKIAQAFENRQIAPRIQLKGLLGAQESFVLAACYNQLRASDGKPYHHLFVANGKEEAAYRQNDLSAILGEERALFFPDSFKRPAFFDELNPTQALQRSEVVNLLSSDGPARIVVSYPEALFEKVVSPHVLDQSRIKINQNEDLDTDFLIDVLVEYGFVRTDFVYEPGQFSIRGGIIDIFSFGNELPYRIELFDTTVESIREFDPLTQLSKRTLAHISLVPNLNTRFRQEQKVSLFQVLPANTLIWIRDYQYLLDRLLFCFEKAEQFSEKMVTLEDVAIRELFRDRAFLYPNHVVEDIADKGVIMLV